MIVKEVRFMPEKVIKVDIQGLNNIIREEFYAYDPELTVLGSDIFGNILVAAYKKVTGTEDNSYLDFEASILHFNNGKFVLFTASGILDIENIEAYIKHD